MSPSTVCRAIARRIGSTRKKGDEPPPRKATARSKEALVEALGTALSALSAADVRGFFFEHAGYRFTGHLP